MDVQMTSEYLHVARSTIYKWAEDQFIPHKKLRKRVLFVKTDIDCWVENNGMIIDDLPEIPKFMTIRTDPPEEIRNSLKDLNQQQQVLGRTKLNYRRAG